MQKLIQKYKEDLVRRDVQKERIESIKKIIDTLHNEAEIAHKAQVLLQTVATQTQEMVKYQIEGIVNEALQTLFPNKYTLSIQFEVKYNRTDADISLLQNGYKINPDTSTGGGVGDILSLTLRVVLLLLSGKERVLVLDQPFGDIDQETKPLAYSILKKLSKELQIQVIAVSHDPMMIDIADTVFKCTNRIDEDGFNKGVICLV